MKLGVQEEFNTGFSYLKGTDLAKKFERLEEIGFEGVEIRLFESEANQKIKEILKAFEDSDVKPSTVILAGDPLRRPLCDQESKQVKIEHAKRTLDYAAQLGCPTLVCPEYGPQIPLPLFDHPRRPTEEEHDLLIQYLQFVGEYAEKNEAYALIEPINRYETHFFYTLEDGINCIKEVPVQPGTR